LPTQGYIDANHPILKVNTLPTLAGVLVIDRIVGAMIAVERFPPDLGE